MQSKRASVRFIEKCYELYEQKMYHVAYSVLHDEGLAEDAVQEAFIKLMKRNVYFAEPASDDCKRYIITVIKNSSINIYNKKKREQEIIYFPGQDSDINNISCDGNVENPVDIEELVSVLPEKYYLVVNCLAVKNLSVKETASELGITEANVRKRFERAKLMLKTIMKGSNGYGEKGQLYKSEVI
ncbi:MAG: sigma-70 family RNA polymerase sigma factor [Lachnospiraceae bacterium]